MIEPLVAPLESCEVDIGLDPRYWVFEFTCWNDRDKTFWRRR
ncbi:hypothetical protein [Haloterrigena alkaliphila]|nr:hypothetical protein [Haloterrigena alkaliphila]